MPSKPSWLTELSVTARESWESNVYLTNIPGPVGNDIANRSSWITSVHPKLTLDLASLFKESPSDFLLQQLSLGYSSEIIRYHEEPGENHEIHRIATGIRGNISSFSFQADNLLSIVDGSHLTPQYSGRSSIATGLIRERRDQIQDRLSLQLRYDTDFLFFRPAASFLYYDLQSEIRNPAGPDAGWQNYTDRYDLNGGGDLGVKILPDFYLTTGYRHGIQRQANLFSTASNSSNTYDRILFGWEGSPLPWLKTKVQFGPDFRDFGNTVPSGHADSKTFFYFDSTLDAALTSRDTLGLKAKQWDWVSGSGINSYQETSFSLLYKHQWSPSWISTTELKWTVADYDAPSTMNDSLYTLHGEVGWQICPHTRFQADYSFSRSQDMTEGTKASTREYQNHLVSLSVKTLY